MENFTLTKEEFIQRSMNGEVFIDRDGDRYFYDKTEVNPFRFNDTVLHSYWNRFNSKVLFTLEQPKPIIERRWKWRRDYEGYTTVTIDYFSDTYKDVSVYENDGWYKSDMYIDVEIKQ